MQPPQLQGPAEPCVQNKCRMKNAGMAAMQTQKQIRILENRLEKMYHKYNESKSHNQGLRTIIDNLRRERLVYDDIHRKLAKSLLTKRKEMAAVIAHTNHILESRDRVGPLLFFSSVVHHAAFRSPEACLSYMMDRKHTHRSIDSLID